MSTEDLSHPITLVTCDPRSPVQVSYLHGANGPKVAIVVEPAQADALAKVLAMTDALTEDAELDFPFDRDVWRRALVDMLAAKAHTGGRRAPVYAMPVAQ